MRRRKRGEGRKVEQNDKKRKGKKLGGCVCLWCAIAIWLLEMKIEMNMYVATSHSLCSPLQNAGASLIQSVTTESTLPFLSLLTTFFFSPTQPTQPKPSPNQKIEPPWESKIHPFRLPSPPPPYYY